MTAQGPPNDEREARAAGASACLTKPFSVSYVRQVAHAWLERGNRA